MNLRFYVKACGLFLLVVLFAVFTVWVWNYKTNLPAPNTRVADDFTYVLRSSHPELFSSNNEPIFTIKSIKKPANGRYILRLASKGNNGPDSFIIVRDPYFGKEYMSIIIGPQSKFSRQELQNKSILVTGATANTLRDEGAL